MNIPKIIHQIWIGPNKPPIMWINTWKVDYINKYPDWQYKLWTEKEINELKLINKSIYEIIYMILQK
ncbi:putative mannosyltransferase OCH1 [Fadolivirus algeromassiliense]|jgi:mannosyltransferase OCH1-like enzyme|uniref:Mannosyltransferase OCH1 n=1 Tax=Fadolivirus FV1/VV64 TaxID=3070911 RepID=A0A7D3V5W7_9VIRU|nr:putative mannosyltransferase OCH1 [Fadolivirus algeromassiliense]QKF94412.1 putative mannosyltransferase OCH1 [Fadolivirus FV1/VV64]